MADYKALEARFQIVNDGRPGVACHHPLLGICSAVFPHQRLVGAATSERYPSTQPKLVLHVAQEQKACSQNDPLQHHGSD